MSWGVVALPRGRGGPAAFAAASRVRSGCHVPCVMCIMFLNARTCGRNFQKKRPYNAVMSSAVRAALLTASQRTARECAITGGSWLPMRSRAHVPKAAFRAESLASQPERAKSTRDTCVNYCHIASRARRAESAAVMERLRHVSVMCPEPGAPAASAAS